MNIGTVQVYGKCNANSVRYGFLSRVDGNGQDIYFNEKGIDRTSKLHEHFPIPCYVVYQERQFDDRVSAFRVKLLEELDQKELDQLYQECRDQGRSAELVVLAKTKSALFSQEPLGFFVPYLEKDVMQKMFQERCAGQEQEKIKAELGEHLEEPLVKRLMIQLYPTLYLDKDPAEYFPYLHFPKVEALLVERIQQGCFDSSVARAYGQFLAAGKGRYVSGQGSSILQAMDLERESLGDLVFLVAQIRAAGYYVPTILKRRPELLWTDAELCASTTWSELEDLPLEQMLQTGEQLAFLARHAAPRVWTCILYNKPLPAALVLPCREAIEQIPDSRISTFVAEINWRDTSKENLEHWQPLLSNLHSNHCPEAVTAGVIALHGQGMALNLCWWKLLSDSMKVRLLIYLSNFKEELQACSAALAEIHKWESAEENQLLCALLRYLVTIYTANPGQRKAQFLKAHHMLMEYITDCFNQRLDVTPGLSSLLEICKGRHTRRKSFCEARIWKRRDSETTDIFCPATRNKCSYYQGGDLKETNFRSCIRKGERPDYQDQFLMDFLLNLGDLPDLNEIGVREREEYPFRIAAYVNSLVRLRPHMQCRFCGELFHPKFEYAKLKNARLAMNRFRCSGAAGLEGEHDGDVYLNFCYHCDRIIDSRECLHREQGGGQYLCMYCGGAQNTKPGTICPRCGSTDPEKLEMKGKSRIICHACGYDSANFVSEMEKACSTL